MEDYIAGQVGSRNRNVVVGKDNQQHDTRADNVIYNNFDGQRVRAAFEEGVDEGMGELSRIIREFSTKIALLEYRMAEFEERLRNQDLWVRLLLTSIVVLLLAIAYGVFWR